MRYLREDAGQPKKVTGGKWRQFKRTDGMVVRCLLVGLQLRHVIIENMRGDSVDVSPAKADLKMIADGLGFRPQLSKGIGRRRTAKGNQAIRLAAG